MVVTTIITIFEFKRSFPLLISEFSLPSQGNGMEISHIVAKVKFFRSPTVSSHFLSHGKTRKTKLKMMLQCWSVFHISKWFCHGWAWSKVWNLVSSYHWLLHGFPISYACLMAFCLQVIESFSLGNEITFAPHKDPQCVHMNLMGWQTTEWLSCSIILHSWIMLMMQKPIIANLCRYNGLPPEECK